jgi:hypothetical protein
MRPQQPQDPRGMIARRRPRNASISVEALEGKNLLSMGMAMPAMAPVMMNPTPVMMNPTPVMMNPAPVMTNPTPVMTNPTPVMMSPPATVANQTNVGVTTSSTMSRSNPVISGVTSENLATIAMESTFPTFAPPTSFNGPMPTETASPNPPMIHTNVTTGSVAVMASPAAASAPEGRHVKSLAPVAHHAIPEHRPVVHIEHRVEHHVEHHAAAKR